MSREGAVAGYMIASGEEAFKRGEKIGIGDPERFAGSAEFYEIDLPEGMEVEGHHNAVRIKGGPKMCSPMCFAADLLAAALALTLEHAGGDLSELASLLPGGPQDAFIRMVTEWMFKAGVKPPASGGHSRPGDSAGTGMFL